MDQVLSTGSLGPTAQDIGRDDEGADAHTAHVAADDPRPKTIARGAMHDADTQHQYPNRDGGSHQNYADYWTSLHLFLGLATSLLAPVRVIGIEY